MFSKCQPCGRDGARYQGSKKIVEMISHSRSQDALGSRGTPTFTSDSANLYMSPCVEGTVMAGGTTEWTVPECKLHI